MHIPISEQLSILEFSLCRTGRKDEWIVPVIMLDTCSFINDSDLKSNGKTISMKHRAPINDLLPVLAQNRHF